MRCGISNTDGNRVSHPDDSQKTIGGNSGPLSQRRDTRYKTRHYEDDVLILQFWSRSPSTVVTADIPRPTSEGSPSTEIGQPITTSPTTISYRSSSTEIGPPATSSLSTTPSDPPVHHAYSPCRTPPSQNFLLL